jgi:hypothetical protein
MLGVQKQSALHHFAEVLYPRMLSRFGSAKHEPKRIKKARQLSDADTIKDRLLIGHSVLAKALSMD